jgi:hypothetical protein
MPEDPVYPLYQCILRWISYKNETLFGLSFSNFYPDQALYSPEILKMKSVMWTLQTVIHFPSVCLSFML